ncbi:inositol monophosphatase family protein [Roseovarius dicentrarchi]|uniref:inositol monophosphatase family protein n=1 Tax=Roseovarius dicentrarchi TaxID=2250573 RepID=UPI000DEA8F3B|nr:inositol monophosphatase family protein [Roseovarius dicentrarchi]
MTTDDLLDECLDLAERAAEMARGYFRGDLGVSFKSDDSPVTQADRAIERLVRDRIAQKFPDHGIVGEEHGADAAGRKRVWVIDPIDGTRSFITGFPLFGFLLAHLVEGRPEIGIISMPMLGEVYTGAAGRGAALNGTPIRASTTTRMDAATLYINEGEKIHAARPEILSRLLAAGQTRRFCHDCYPYALLAAGHVDVVVDYDLQPYDFMALRPVVTEAGGILTDWSGRVPQLDYSGPIVAAATPELHAAALALLRD